MVSRRVASAPASPLRGEVQHLGNAPVLQGGRSYWPRRLYSFAAARGGVVPEAGGLGRVVGAEPDADADPGRGAEEDAGRWRMRDAGSSAEAGPASDWWPGVAPLRAGGGESLAITAVLKPEPAARRVISRTASDAPAAGRAHLICDRAVLEARLMATECLLFGLPVPEKLLPLLTVTLGPADRVVERGGGQTRAAAAFAPAVRGGVACASVTARPLLRR
jgi:hypothetical protein